MAAKPANPQPIPRQWQSFLSRVKSTVNARKLSPVLESLPEASKFRFCEASVFKKRALKFDIGIRKQTDGDLARSWAYILLDLSDIDQPVLFYDEPLTTASSAQPCVYPRAATSLVRRATNLSEPFRFLQVDPHDDATNVRGMVCSLVAYYALASGLNDCAIKWAKFESSFIDALKYIDSRTEYGRWLDGGEEDPNATLDEHMSDAEDAAIEVAGASAADDVSHSGSSDNVATIRSSGSSVTITPGCTLAKLRTALGNKFYLLDAIPPVPITIEPQANFPKYFPFRLHLGSYHGSKVYVYLTLDGKTMKIYAHGADNVHSWSFHELERVDLVEPFDFLMHHGKTDANTRGAKVRCFVGYYFMLAENAGMIGDPHLRANSTNMIAMLCASCGDLERRSRDGGNGAAQSGPSRATQSGPSKAAKTVPQMQSLPVANGSVRRTRNMTKTTRPSLIVKLTIRPGLLASVARPSTPSQRSEDPYVEVDGPVNFVDRSLNQQRQEFEKRSRDPVIPNQHPRIEQQHEGHDNTNMKGIQKSGYSKQGSYRNHSHDSGFASSSAPPPATARTPANHTRHTPIEELFENMDTRSVTAGADEYQDNEPLETLPDTSTTLPDADKRNARARSVSFISINSARDAVGNGSKIAPAPASRTSVFPPIHETERPRESIVVDPGSEGEDSVIVESPKREIEETPEVEVALSPHRGFRQVSGDSELRLPPQSGARKKTQVVSDDEDMFVEEDDDAWKRASQGKHPLSADEMWRNWE
ncbi:hypothetical protein CC86DRAFT_472348 [Ophiobolus disseminans]|uniref:Uncharacterized protein n=1 Tax=Ophiobolus disseminans TaxID=1469910 RepID=A0A6A6ZG18_9PLEO|nr:hypothetical protein CC86DRAFT_472348 [Ophiobolus disseminans]